MFLKKGKIISITLVIIFIACFYSHSNERITGTKKIDSSFSFRFLGENDFSGLTFDSKSNANSSIRLYKLSSAQWTNIGLAMGIAGSVMAGVGILCIIPGAALMGVSVAYYGAPYYPQRTPPPNAGYAVWFSGVGLLAGGIVLFVVGVPLAIVGFILYFKGGKFSTLIESDKDRARLGFAIKL